LSGADKETRWTRVVTLGLPLCDPATLERPLPPDVSLTHVGRPSTEPHRAPTAATSDADGATPPPLPVAVLPRGGVVDLPAHRSSWSTSITWPSHDHAAFDVDVVALLTDADEQVRADTDFVFYNAPAAADGSVELTLDIPNEALVDIRLDRIPGDVQRIILAATLSGGQTSQPASPAQRPCARTIRA
jgi:DNA polymerase-3 subunit epsilon